MKVLFADGVLFEVLKVGVCASVCVCIRKHTVTAINTHTLISNGQHEANLLRPLPVFI